MQVLALVDSMMVTKCTPEVEDKAGNAAGAWLTIQDAPAQHQLARKLHLGQYEALVGRFLGKHAHAIDLTRLDASYAAMLQGARLMQK